jgi:hypothetical protein
MRGGFLPLGGRLHGPTQPRSSAPPSCMYELMTNGMKVASNVNGPTEARFDVTEST